MKNILLKYLALSLLAMQAECDDCEDTGDFPVGSKNTNLNRVPGGYRGFALKKCSYTFADISDIAEWETAIAAGDVHVILSCKWILGSKAGDNTTNTEGSCEVEDIANQTSAFTFIHSGDNTANDIDTFFIDWKSKKGEGWDLAPVKCDGTTIRDFYSGTASITLGADDVKSGKESWTIVFTSNIDTEKPRILLPFDLSTLTGI